ncbi:PREDICTED: putative nuclease HARBI1 [Wasmannia auropunctata]|uniref:putative nuclease HARBI1 n=1 Tax=Wasmannia auropunctata TaxID=64793 RepID=UPI0005EE5A49|nr:PREDICTED: putative nuclease HARBI1 [Wasmannia auropunctata]
MRDYLHIPNEFEAIEIANNFEKICHIPQIIGCIDGSHVPILAPAKGYRDYVNRKGWPSYNFQAVIDDRYLEIFASDTLEKTHDAAVFKDSNLYKNIILVSHCGTKIIQQDSFNVHFNSARVRVEMAFGRLRRRWKILLKRIDVSYIFVPNIISACCILHNFLEYTNEQFVQQWLEHVAEAKIMIPQPDNAINRECNNIFGSDIRDGDDKTDTFGDVCENIDELLFELRDNIDDEGLHIKLLGVFEENAEDVGN